MDGPGRLTIAASAASFLHSLFLSLSTDNQYISDGGPCELEGMSVFAAAARVGSLVSRSPLSTKNMSGKNPPLTSLLGQACWDKKWQNSEYFDRNSVKKREYK